MKRKARAPIFSARGTVRDGKITRPFTLSVGPVARGKGDWKCRVRLSYPTPVDSQVYGIDRTQARELAFGYVHVLLGDAKLKDARGKPIVVPENPWAGETSRRGNVAHLVRRKRDEFRLVLAHVDAKNNGWSRSIRPAPWTFDFDAQEVLSDAVPAERLQHLGRVLLFFLAADWKEHEKKGRK